MSPKFLRCRLTGGGLLSRLRLQLFDQHLPGEKSVLPLIPGGLTFHLDSGRSMDQLDARGDFIDVLPAVASRPDKRLFEVRFVDSQCSHALGKLLTEIGMVVRRMNAIRLPAPTRPRDLEIVG